MILLVDNYDSFTYNLRHYLGNREVIVLRNDDSNLFQVAEKAAAIIFSPGPGKPSEAGRMEELIRSFYKSKPLLGICLGHQGIGEIFGAQVVFATEICHGKISPMEHNQETLFAGLASPLQVMRYHSLMLLPESLPPCLMITSRCGDVIMGIKHQEYPVYGLQFHPESIGTEAGQQIITNFLAELEESI